MNPDTEVFYADVSGCALRQPEGTFVVVDRIRETAPRRVHLGMVKVTSQCRMPHTSEEIAVNAQLGKPHRGLAGVFKVKMPPDQVRASQENSGELTQQPIHRQRQEIWAEGTARTQFDPFRARLLQR